MIQTQIIATLLILALRLTYVYIILLIKTRGIVTLFNYYYVFNYAVFSDSDYRRFISPVAGEPQLS
jgi:hypothetical protein